MTLITKAYVGAQIHDGVALREDHALACEQTGFVRILPRNELPEACPVEHLNAGVITPRFVDLQLNGGGGVMFNDDQSVTALEKISKAHALSGTGTILPTLITDTYARTSAAIDAVEQAIAAKVDGIAGIHLEGPHLSVARKGAHDPKLIRKMDDDDLALMLSAAERLANVMVTVAPENTSNAQIKAMADAGIVVSLGHTDADYATCHAAFDAGARCVTHLFNAMSQLGNREPGLVGACLERDGIFAGLIADGIHVHPASIKLALAAKPRSEQIFLVSDAMATAGSDIDHFAINGRDVYRREQRLTLKDGTLAGADLDIPRALSIMTDTVGDTLQTGVARATSIPAQLLREAGDAGRIGETTTEMLYFSNGFTTPQMISAKN